MNTLRYVQIMNKVNMGSNAAILKKPRRIINQVAKAIINVTTSEIKKESVRSGFGELMNSVAKAVMIIGTRISKAILSQRAALVCSGSGKVGGARSRLN